MKKTKLLLIFIIVSLILYLGYQVKIIYDYGIAVQQEFALKHESQLKFITNLKFNGMILKKIFLIMALMDIMSRLIFVI